MPLRPPDGPVRLRADVTLGPVLPDCAERMLRWVSDPEVSGHVGIRQVPSLEKTLAWIENAANDASVRPFAILLGDRHVGNVVLDRIDPHLGTARFSIYIGEPDARANGVGRSAAHLALRAAFEGLQLYKVWLTVHAENTRAIQSYLRVGFRQEGVLRGEFLLNGVRLDLLYMGILASEFADVPVEGGAGDL